MDLPPLERMGSSSKTLASSDLQMGHKSGQRKGGLGKISLPQHLAAERFACET